MNVDLSKDSNKLLESLRREIESHTNCQLESLELKYDNDEISIFASACCYYDLQMVLVAVQSFTIKKPTENKFNIEISVAGHVIKL